MTDTTGMKEHDIAGWETERTYIYDDGFEYTIENPEKLFITESGGHRILDVLGTIHSPKNNWRVITWEPKDIKVPVKF